MFDHVIFILIIIVQDEYRLILAVGAVVKHYIIDRKYRSA